jgi:hypothetical protein
VLDQVEGYACPLAGSKTFQCGPGDRRRPMAPSPLPLTVLGRFVYALNGFCKSQYNMSYDVSDYWIYEFAKVSVLPAHGVGARGLSVQAGRGGGAAQQPGRAPVGGVAPSSQRLQTHFLDACLASTFSPQIWGCDQDRSNHIVHAFFESPHFNDGIPIIPGARLNPCPAAGLSRLAVPRGPLQKYGAFCARWFPRIGWAVPHTLRSPQISDPWLPPPTSRPRTASQTRSARCSGWGSGATWWSSPAGSTSSRTRRWSGSTATTRGPSRRCAARRGGRRRGQPGARRSSRSSPARSPAFLRQDPHMPPGHFKWYR